MEKLHGNICPAGNLSGPLLLYPAFGGDANNSLSLDSGPKSQSTALNPSQGPTGLQCSPRLVKGGISRTPFWDFPGQEEQKESGWGNSMAGWSRHLRQDKARRNNRRTPVSARHRAKELAELPGRTPRPKVKWAQLQFLLETLETEGGSSRMCGFEFTLW